MLYLLNKDVRTVRWNGEPLHEATSAIVKETMNGDFTLTVKYPISDSGIYQLIQEDMLIKAPTPVLGAQLFRIKKPVENNDHLEITAYHISDDVMQRSITSMSVTSQSCGMALSRMVQNTKTALGDFSFNSDIQDRRTFNTTETETLYSVLLDGKHSIVGTWEGELVRDNFAMTIKKSRGENRGVVITTHKNLKDYQRTKNSQNVVTRIHAKSTFKPEGADKETTIRVTVDSPLINSYPYINEKEYENNNAKTVEELQKWAQAKFTNQGIDKVSDAIKIEAYELDGQVVHMGDTVNLKSWKHNVDAFKKAIAYEFDALKEEYISLTFDDKAETGGSRASGGLSSAADAIIGVTESAQEIALEKALQNADLDFDHKAGLLRQEISDGIELTRAKAEEVKRELSDTIDQRFSSFNNGPLQEAKRRAEEALRNAGASSLLAQEAKRIALDSTAKLEEFKRQTTNVQTALSGDLDALKRTIANDIRPKQAQAEADIAKQVEALVQTKKELAGIKSEQAIYEETTTRRLSELTNLANGKASKSELTQTAEELASKLASVQASGRNLFLNSLFKKDISKTGIWTTSTYEATIDSTDKYLGHNALKIVGQNPSGRDNGNPKITYPALGQYGKNVPGSMTNQDVTISFYAKASKNGIMLRSRLGNINYKTGNVILSTEIKRYVVHIPKSWTNESKFSTNEWLFNFNQEGTVWIWMPKFEISDVDTSYSEAPEDIEGQISAVESNFRQRADSLDAGVRSLTEGLRTKADISSLNVTAENIRQSVKSLETSTQNKLDQKLSMAEFEVRASSIRQEILNATKDKADKTLVVAEAGKLREEFSSLRVGGRNFIRNYNWNRLLPLNGAGPSWEFERVEDQFAKSGYMLKATCTKNGNGGFHKVFFDLRAAEFQGKDMTWSWDIKSSRPITFYAMGFEAGGLKRNVPVSTEWERISNTFKVAFKQYYSCVFYANGWEVGDVVYIRDPQLEEGTIATSPKPAPEDTDGLITEAKATFERTAEGLRTDLSAIQEYVNKDGQRQEALQRYTREESARQATAVRELVTRDYVGKATYQEDMKGINQRIEAVKTSANKDIASQIASYRQSVDGKFTDISSQITTYKQDLGGQISGLSNRLTSSEQGTTTQISNLSNRINSNKQGTDNQISNLKTQVATNKDNAERQMGRISDQVSANKANADSQFANVSNQLARKVETTDFQRVKETSQLYERILGNTENGIADKVARMAMTNQLFQVEVGKAFAEHQNLFLNSTLTKGFLGNNGIIYVANATQKEVTSDFISVDPNEKIIFQHWVTLPENGIAWTAWQFFDKNKNPIDNRKPGLNAYKTTVGKQHNINQITVPANAYFVRFSARMYDDGLIKVEKGSTSSDYSVAPNDALEAVKTVQTQLAGSWGVHNKNSVNEIIAGFNLAGRNAGIKAETIRLEGNTLADKLTAIDGYFKRLFVGEGTFATLNTDILRANSITADKLVMDMAMARRFVSSDLFTDTLAAKEAFINKLRSVVVTATFLEGFQGKIGGFRLGQYKNRNGYFITGTDSVSVGMGNGTNDGANRNAFWANWGDSLDTPGPKSWYVNTDGTMYCRNEVSFYSTVDFASTSNVNFYSRVNAEKGLWLAYNDVFGEGDNPVGGYNRVVWWSQIVTGKFRQHAGITTGSDRKLKENIEPTPVKALDKINALNLVAFDYIKDKTHEEIGLIAQEVLNIIPGSVEKYEGEDNHLTINYSKFVPYLIKAIQELNEKIEEMEKTVA